MVTFKQLLAGLMTAGLILGSLPVMGAGKAVKLSLMQRGQGRKEADTPKVKITPNESEGSAAYQSTEQSKTTKIKARKERMKQCVDRMKKEENDRRLKDQEIGRRMLKLEQEIEAREEAGKIKEKKRRYDNKIQDIKSGMAFSSSILTIVGSAMYFMRCFDKALPLSPIEAGLWFAINGSLSYIHYLEGEDSIDTAKEDNASQVYGRVNKKEVTYREFLTCEGRKMKRFSYCMAGLSAVGLLTHIYRNVWK